MDKLPEDIKQEALSYIRGYERRRKIYRQKYYEIINSPPAAFTIAEADGEMIHIYNGHSNIPGNPTANKALQLAQLEQHPDTIKMRAVEQAKKDIGADVADDDVRQRLINALWINCLSGRCHPFEHLNLTEFSRMDFYSRKHKFLRDISDNFIKLSSKLVLCTQKP